MSVAVCRSRRTRRPPKKNCARAFTQAGYYVYSVKSRGLLAGAGKAKKVKLETFLVFNQQFLTLIRAGLPILGSIELLARRQKLPHFRAQLEDVATRVKNGESISEAFVAQGGFPVVYTTTLLAGERSGKSRRGPAALPRLPARLAHLPQEAPRQPHLSRRAGLHGDRASSSSSSPLSSPASPSSTSSWAPSCPPSPPSSWLWAPTRRATESMPSPRWRWLSFSSSAGSRPTRARTWWTASASASRSSVPSG